MLRHLEININIKMIIWRSFEAYLLDWRLIKIKRQWATEETIETSGHQENKLRGPNLHIVNLFTLPVRKISQSDSWSQLHKKSKHKSWTKFTLKRTPNFSVQSVAFKWFPPNPPANLFSKPQKVFSRANFNAKTLDALNKKDALQIKNNL